MIVLWILLILLALILLLLFAPITIILRWNEQLQVKVRFLFITLDVLKLAKGNDKKKENKKKKPSKKQKKTPVTTEEAAPQKKKRSLSELLDFIGFLAKLLKEVLQEFFSRLKIRVRKLKIVVAHEEPDRTAMLYGLVCPAVYQLCEIVNHFTRSDIDYNNVFVHSDFSSDKFRAELDLRLSIRIIDLLATGAKALAAFQLLKSNAGGTVHERNSLETSH